MSSEYKSETSQPPEKTGESEKPASAPSQDQAAADASDNAPLDF